MRKCVYMTIAVLMLVMALAGCGGSVDDSQSARQWWSGLCSSDVVCGDARLVHANGVMDNDADSAMLVLRGIEAGELQSDADRALYALLYTQGQYKTMDSIANDSLINVALEYYKDNRNRSLYTRALIYKGAVMQELGNDAEAMMWYKRAEANASDDDYMNLGQVNMRMSVLYSLNYADSREIIAKKRKALDYYRKAGNKSYELMCLGGLGGEYRLVDMDSAYKYLREAIELARELNDEYQLYRNTLMLSRALVTDSLYAEAKDIAVPYIYGGCEYIDDDIYYDAAMAYAHLGMADSAEYYLGKTSEPMDEQMRVTRLMALADVAHAQGDYHKAFHYMNESEKLSEQIVMESKNDSVRHSEVTFEESKHADEKVHLHSMQKVLLLVMAIVAVIAMIMIGLYVKRRRELKETQMLMETLEREKSELEKNNERCDGFMSNHIKLMKELKDCYYKFSSNPVLFMKQYHKLIEVGNYDENFWVQLEQSLPAENKARIEEIKTKHDNVSRDDERVMVMLCLGFTYTEITVCMGYSHPTRIYTKKNEIAKKLKLECSIDEYLGLKK